MMHIIFYFCLFVHIMFSQMDAEKRSFLKTAKKWPKAIVPYKIDKKSIGKLFNYNSVCFISKILTIVLKFITSHIVLSLLKCVWVFLFG